MYTIQRTFALFFWITSFISLVVATKSKPITVTEENWTQVLEGEWMVEFMAPWCPACRAFTETWKKFAEGMGDQNVKVGVVDVTQNPGLSGRFLVSALPTIYYIKDSEFRQYKGGRKDQELVTFIEEKKFEDIEPVSWYLSPSSYQMGAVGFFFKAAMKIRALYNVMTSEYGIPEWACYLIFALLTITVGLVLGLLIVCCCDLVFPAKYPPMPDSLPPGARPEKQESDVETETDDILDDTNATEDEEEEEEDLSQGEEVVSSDKTDDDKTQESKEDSSPSKPRRRRPKKAD